MNYLDIILIVPLIVGAWRGFKKGFIISFFTLLALLVGLYAGIHFSDFISNWLHNQFGFNSKYLPIISFTFIFLIVGAMVFFAGKALEKVVSLVALTPLNKMAGLVFGILKAVLLTSSILFILDGYDKNNEFIPKDLKNDSLLYYPIKHTTSSIIPAFKENLINHSVDQVIH